MHSRLLVVLLGFVFFLHGGNGATWEDLIEEKIKSAAEEFEAPLKTIKDWAERELNSLFEAKNQELETKKRQVILQLKKLPEDCAGSYIDQLNGMDLDSCENLTYSLEKLHQSVIKGYNMSSQIWDDLKEVASGAAKCPNLNPILVARCLIETLKDVRDKIATYKPILVPYEEEVKVELIEIKDEIVLCLNYKKDHADAKLNEAKHKCAN